MMTHPPTTAELAALAAAIREALDAPLPDGDHYAERDRLIARRAAYVRGTLERLADTGTNPAATTAAVRLAAAECPVTYPVAEAS